MNMKGYNTYIRQWLYPAAWLYGAGVCLRNKLFDLGWLKSKNFDIPIISIGNIAVGGTGKTPHTEYLIRLLKSNGLNVASLSRGYKRKTKGYMLADGNSNARLIGDEPCQIHNKFRDIRVAVDEDRCHGIVQLLKLDNPVVDVIVLDDAFQHRHVKTGLNILLTDYHRLWCDDTLIPAGKLREPTSGKKRAQIVVVTKCPEHIKPTDFNIIAKRLQLYPYQQLYFSRLRYGILYSLFPQNDSSSAVIHKDDNVLLVTGIASPTPLIDKIREQTTHFEVIAFADHHDFTYKDLQRIKKRFELLGQQNGYREKKIITTEKDAARLKNHPQLDNTLKPYIYVMPIEIEILQNQQDIFNQNIINYVRTNPRNSCFPEERNAHIS